MRNQLTDSELVAIQDRSRAAWNRLIRRDEDEQRRANEQADVRRAEMHVVRPDEEQT